MRMALELGGNDLLKTKFNRQRRFSRRKTRAVADAKQMGVHRNGRLAERDVEHHVRGLAADAGQRFQRLARARYVAVVLGDQFFRQRDDVLRLVAIEPDGLDVIADFLLAEGHHLFRRVGHRKQVPRRLVDSDVGRLRRQRYRHQQRIRIEMFEFALRLRIGLAETGEGLDHLGVGPRFDPGFFCRRFERLGDARLRG